MVGNGGKNKKCAVEHSHWRRIIGVEGKKSKSTYKLNVNILARCYFLADVFLNAQVRWKYVLCQYCNVFLAGLHSGSCVAAEGLCCPVSTPNRKVLCVL